MRIMRFVLAAFAVLAFSAMAASSALAAGHPLFITQSGQELLFSGEGGKGTLRASGGGVIECEKTLIDGFALNKSTLAHRILVTFEGKCESVSPKASCSNEGANIMTKPLLGELGLQTSTNHKVVILLGPSSGTESAKFTCGGILTFTVTGAIVGEIPETNAKLEKQYNTKSTTTEEVFLSEAKTSKQAITEIFLLGTQMSGVHLLSNGEEASEEVSSNPILKNDGTIEIETNTE